MAKKSFLKLRKFDAAMEEELLIKALRRERLARKEAEHILEKKSLELYHSNLQLQEVITTTDLFPGQNPNAVMRYSGRANTLSYANRPGKKISSFLDKKLNARLKKEFIRELNFSFEKEINHQFDMQIDGKTIRFFAVPLPLIDYINIYTADISDIKASEKRLKNITASLKQAQKVAGMGSWEFDLYSNQMVWSEDLFKILQVNPENFKPSHKSYINLLHPSDKAFANEAVYRAINHKEEYILTLRRIFDDRKEIYIECRGQVCLDREGNVNRLHGVCVDVTDKIEIQLVKESFTKKLEEKVKERTLKLINSEKQLRTSLMKEKELGDLKSSFVSTASHQFRTPLTVIKSNVGLLEMFIHNNCKQEFQNFQKVNDRITSAINKMTELMDNALVLGKLTSGNVQWSPQEFSLIDFCQKLAVEFKHTQTDGRTLNVTIHGEPFNVQVDPNLLYHALSNLINNAFKYSFGKKSPELAIQFKPKELVLSIKDYGIGIPENELQKLFRPFFRANNATEIKGTGLGLSIAKEYIEVNKGSIGIKSTLEEGSCFEIKFKR